MKLRSFLIALSVVGLVPSLASAFDIVNRKTSYLDSKYVTLGLSLGFTDFAQQTGVAGQRGFGFRLSAGHHLNRYLQAELYYQFSTFDLLSPDPVAPTRQIETGASMSQEAVRLIATWPAVLAQPFVSAGIGGYNFLGVNAETGLSFPMELQIPVGAGIRAYIYKNLISFNAEFDYHFIFGENQDAGTLGLLGINEVSFDTYSALFGFNFHFL